MGYVATAKVLDQRLLHDIAGSWEGPFCMRSRQYNILYPVDFSDRCVLAARYVKAWVDRLGAALNTLHVVDANALGYPRELHGEFRYNELPHLMDKRTADLKHFSDQYFGKDIARSTVLTGGRWEEIEYFAKREKIDLIMLPRNHQSLLARILHDSLTATLLERCTASVWTTEHLDDARSSSVNGILCAVHFERDVTLEAQNHRILQTIRELATKFQAKVTFLRVIDGNEEREKSSAHLRTISGVEPWLTQARELLGQSAAFLRKIGNVVSAISDTADQVAADLVVVGRTRPGTIGFGVQGHILKIDQGIRCPVLSVW
jgi:nucleotide-binding universal stress UspA family protein